jgi:hypothetical protein
MASAAVVQQQQSTESKVEEISQVVGGIVGEVVPGAQPVVQAVVQLEPVAFHLGQLLAHLFSHYHKSQPQQKQ